jgi:polysaccharide pyruvyl transferase WcaK-like protein
MRCLLIGNFGVSNLGDEALKDYFLQRYPSVDWMVVSGAPKSAQELYRLPTGIRSLLTLRWLKTLLEYKRCDAIVFGGGSLFTDAESLHACFLWWLHALPARVLRRPIHLAFQGIGPFNTRLGLWLTLSVCRSAATISVRDSLSYGRLRSRGLSNKCVQSCDPIYSLFKAEKVELCSKNILTVIPRNNSSEKCTTAARLAFQSTSWDAVRVLSMKPDDESEIEYCQTLIDTELKGATLVKVRSVEEILQNIADSGLVVTERYHGALAALALGKKVEIVSQTDGDKLTSLSFDALQDWDTLLKSGEELLGL